jgi:hypothetical protein
MAIAMEKFFGFESGDRVGILINLHNTATVTFYKNGNRMNC